MILNTSKTEADGQLASPVAFGPPPQKALLGLVSSGLGGSVAFQLRSYFSVAETTKCISQVVPSVNTAYLERSLRCFKINKRYP
ncbi:hypothetical protein CEXT_291021 [Caerostris extrusa]|uniref:Uncharacterized protein n=1 Tax=Caerostris extrusa TaxID=172846 RepID=A0AAV4NWW4_CAEEX|nr:hypothetical protein CEXT_291021 [Caerostris extrusa]